MDEPTGDDERAVLFALLEKDFPGSAELRAQALRAHISRIESGGSPALLFRLGDATTPAPVTQRVPVEGEFGDYDGTRIHCLLHVVDGVLAELEFYREDGGSITSLPPLSELRVIVS